jgi:hypothetical protein
MAWARASSIQPCISRPPWGPVPGKDHAAHQVWALQSDLLGDEPADGEAEEVDFGEAERVDEGERVSPEGRERRRYRAARQPDAGGVEQDDLPLVGDVVEEGGIPVVQVAAEVLEEDDGNGAGLSVTPVGVGGAVGGIDGEVGRRVLGREDRCHRQLLTCSVGRR